MKQGKDISEAHIDKDVLGDYVENIDEFNNSTRSKNKNKIKS